MDVVGLISRLQGKYYTVTTASGAGSYDPNTGHFIEGAQTTVQVMGSLQPLSGDELLTIPEGDRSRERFRFYSYPALKGLRNVTLNKSDYVTIDGVAYQVDTIWHWPTYSKAVLVTVATNVS